MLEGGLRLSHAPILIESFRPEEEIEIQHLHLFTRRLVCFESNGFCRYYLGVGDIVKPCERVYISIDTLRFLKKYRGLKIDMNLVQIYAKRHGLVLPKMIRRQCGDS